MTAPLLQLQQISKHFGGLAALDRVDFHVQAGEILGLIGPNGAGKTVCFNVISGVYKPDGGTIQFDGSRTDGLSPHQIARLGIGRTFQIVKPFASLSVLENVLVAQGIDRYDDISKIWSRWKVRSQLDEALDVLARVDLKDLGRRKAGLLPLGNLRRLEIARALVVGHKLLLLDESFSGLRHEEISKLEDLIERIRQGGMTVLLIEHNMRVAMGLCDRLVVLDHGRKIAEGSPEAVQRDENVIEAYLGRSRKGSRHAA
jgi:branched-chain amino acid transport system ATP-binding protein